MLVTKILLSKADVFPPQRLSAPDDLMGLFGALSALGSPAEGPFMGHGQCSFP